MLLLCVSTDKLTKTSQSARFFSQQCSVTAFVASWPSALNTKGHDLSHPLKMKHNIIKVVNIDF